MQLVLQSCSYKDPSTCTASAKMSFVMQHGKALEVHDPDIVRSIMVAGFTVAEPVRLYAGFSGNLRGNVSAAVLRAAPCVLSCFVSHTQGAALHEMQDNPTLTMHKATDPIIACIV